MKEFLFLIVLLTSCFAIDYYAQQTYSPSSPTYRKDIYKDGNNSVQTGGLITGSTTTKYYVGKNSTVRKRAVYQWNINDDAIPNGSTINTARLAFLYTAPGTGVVFPPRFFNVGLDLQNASLTDLWTNTDPATQAGISDKEATLDWKFDYTFVSGTDQTFINAIQNSLISDKFVLGVAWKYESPSAGNGQWQVHYDILLEINFTPPTQNVVVDQKLLNHSSVDSVGLWHSTLNKFDKYSVPKTFPWDVNDTKTLQGSQKLLSNQKYNTWLNAADIVNHHSFIIEPSTGQLASQFNPTNPGITIKNSLESSSATGGNAQFRDPWFIDYPDPAFGNTLRNRGMTDAVFYSRPSPFYPDYNTVYNGYKYQGVFLSQSGPPLWTPPYYSVKVEAVQNITLYNTGVPWGRTHKFYFQNWSGTNANFQNANALETPVVFISDGAVVNANLKGTQLSDNTNAYANNSQRKLVRTTNGILHNVYESQNRVWYEISTDNGANWQLMNNGRPLSEVDSKLPSIDYYGSQVAIVFQEKNGNGYNIMVKVFYPFDYQYRLGITSTVYTETNEGYSVAANPVIAWAIMLELNNMGRVI